jgi:hypothetical protein
VGTRVAADQCYMHVQEHVHVCSTRGNKLYRCIGCSTWPDALDAALGPAFATRQTAKAFKAVPQSVVEKVRKYDTAHTNRLSGTATLREAAQPTAQCCHTVTKHHAHEGIVRDRFQHSQLSFRFMLGLSSGPPEHTYFKCVCAYRGSDCNHFKNCHKTS